MVSYMSRHNFTGKSGELRLLVQRLIEYAERLDALPKYCESKPVNWIVEVDQEGRFIGTGFTFTEKKKQMVVPFLARAGTKLAPILLYDKAEYSLGYCLEDATEQNRRKAGEKHASFLQLLRDCAEATGNQDVRVVLRALEQDNPQRLFPKDMNPGEWVVFRVEDRFPHDAPEVQSYWADLRDRERPQTEGAFTCIGCGQDCTPVPRHDLPIPIRGGHSKGAKLISANDKAYFSYGLENSLIAPTCASCADKYAKSLTHLLTSPKTHITFGELTYAFWARQETGFFLLDYMKQPDPESVKLLFTSAYRGTQLGVLEDSEFYAVALSPYISRIVVRDWMESTLQHVKERLTRWFSRQNMYHGPEERYFGIYTLAASLFRDATKEMSQYKNVPLYLLQHALFGKPLPSVILQQALQRTKAERRITAPRAVLIKMYLMQNQETYKEDDLMAVDQERTDPAYLCGRLFAILDQIQYEAIGSNSTIADRYYGTASTAPASVLGTLVRYAQNHLTKLRRDRKGKYVALNRTLGEIMEPLTEFPKLLNPEEQGLFAIGYYHQQQVRFPKSKPQVQEGEE